MLKAGLDLLLPMAFLALVLPGCSSVLPVPDSPSRAPEPEALAAMERGLEAFRTGDLREAQARFLTAILLDDSLVKAHIHYQNTWIARARRGTAMEEYRARLEKEPTGFNHYLYGRLLEDHTRRLDHLNQAVSRNPSLAWAFLERSIVLENLGKRKAALENMDRAALLDPLDPDIQVNRGYFFLRRRQPHRAMNCFSKAIQLDGENDKAYFGLYRTHARYDATRNAMRSLKECLLLQPIKGLYLRELRHYAERHASFQDLKQLEKVLEKVREEYPKNGEVLQTLGWIRGRNGRPYDAVSCLTRAAGKGGLDPTAVRDLVGIHVRSGQYARALERFLDFCPSTLLLDRKNLIRSRWIKVMRATRAATRTPSAPALHSLARAYVRVGWVKEALQVYDRLSVVEPDVPGLEKEREACTRFLNFIEVLRNYFESRYKAFKKGGAAGSMKEVLRDLSRLARLNAGVADPGPLPLKSFLFIGSVLDREKAECHPLLTYFDRFNHYLILGQRKGNPPEAILCSRQYKERHVNRPRFGRTVPHFFVVGSHVKVRSFRESLEQNLGGVTIGRELFVNLDFVQRWSMDVMDTFRKFSSPRMRADLFHDLAMPAASRAEALDLSNPLSTRKRLYYLHCLNSGERAGDVEVYLDMVRTHEEGHVLDSQRYLPILNNLWRVLGLAINQGFSPVRVEGHLEGNAEVTAMAEGPAPRLSLAQLIGFLPSATAAPPHSLGYHAIVTRIVQEVYDHPRRYPEVDRSRNILQQLPRLNPDHLRRIARKIAGERNMR